MTAQPSPQPRALAGSLLALITSAERANDRRFHALNLKHGLRVDIGLGTHINLRLSRRGSAPSFNEWHIVIDNLPPAYQPQEDIAPSDFTHGDRKYLEAHWPFTRRTA